MKPLRLTVRAFGPYARDQAFDFADLKGRSFFLIHGPTGAGKTSVLDAMCFALYGQASGPQRQPRQLRSDHADPKTLTEVVFDFAIGPEVYRVRRAPEQERPKKKGEGFVTQQPDATLWKRTSVMGGNGDGTPAEGAVVAEGWQKVNDAVERLMGFQADQFRQVVMLPQGQFQRLLTAKSDERQSILENLFDVGTFGRIEQSLKDAAAGVRKRIEDARLAHAEILRGFDVAGVDDLTVRRDGAQVELAQVRGRGEGLRQAKTSAAEALAAARQAAEKLRELDDARRSLRALEGRQEEFAKKQAAHARACKAAGLAEAEASLQQWRLEAAAANRKLADSRAASDRAATALATARADWATQVASEETREHARREVERLAALEERMLLLAQARGKSRTATEQVGRLMTEREEAAALLEKARRSVEAAEREAKRVEGVACLLESRQAVHREAEKAVKDRTRLDAARADHRVAQDVWHRAQLKVATFQEQFATAKSAWQEAEAAARRGQAAALARALSESVPCPVCGSTHHPSPATGGGDVPSEADVAKLRESVEHLEYQLAELRESAAEATARVGEAAVRAHTFDESLGAHAAADPDHLRQALKQAKAELDRAEAAGLELSGVARRIEQLRPQLALAETRLADADAARQRAEADAGAARAVVAEREAGIPEALRQGADLDQALRAAQRRLNALADAFEAARVAAQEAEVAQATAQAALSAAEESAANARRQSEAAEGSFARRLADAGFEDLPAYQAAKLTDRQIEALEREGSAYRIDLQAARSRLDRASAAAEGLTAPDVAALQSAALAADAALEANVRQEEALSQQLRHLDDALARLKELGDDLRCLDARYQVVGRIAEVAGGKNDYRMTFQRYVLGVFLDQVLEAATQRLKVMSRGRYLLQRVRDAASGNRAGGLDLEVFDQHTSTTRPVSTLSGGESFLASLALALGLSDVVQAYAGGIRLETIFVDEGFGSLDPEALDLAIRALRDLQQGGRLVGIISHVTELKEWIDARLEVLPGRRGSTARFVVP